MIDEQPAAPAAPASVARTLDFLIDLDLEEIDPHAEMQEAAARALADRLLTAKRAAADELDALTEESGALHAAVEARLDTRARPILARIAWMNDQLRALFRFIPLRGGTAKRPKKSVALLSGTLGTKTKAGGFRLESEPDALAWAENNAPSCIDRKPKLSWTKLKEWLEGAQAAESVDLKARRPLEGDLAGGPAVSDVYVVAPGVNLPTVPAPASKAKAFEKVPGVAHLADVDEFYAKAE